MAHRPARRRSLQLDKRSARAVASGQPWVYADVVEAAGLRPRCGEEIDLLDAVGAFLGRGLAEGPTVSTGPALRVFTRDHRSPPLPKLLFRRVARCRELRQRALPRDTDGYRLIHGEGDELPGVVVDRYGPWLVVRPDGDLWTPHLPALVEALRTEGGAGCLGVVLKARRSPLKVLWGEQPPPSLVIREAGRRYLVRLAEGQKTGFFLDQRPNRSAVQALTRPGDRVLNLFSYTGGFSVAAALGGASHVCSVDLSEAIMADCRAQFPLNELDDSPHSFIAADVFTWLSAARHEAPYDVVICDPPALSRKRSDLPAARRAYQKLHRDLSPVLARRGLLITASCTSRLGPEDLLCDVMLGLEQGGRRVTRVLAESGAGADHPVTPGFRQSRYLSCLTLAVD